jgi:hypothetical protein
MIASERNQGASAELNEKIAAARTYHSAQQSLMHAIVEESSAADITHAIDVTRVGHAIFSGTKPFDTETSSGATPDKINATVKFLELLVEIRKSETLIKEWLATAERSDISPLERYIDQALEVSADPRYDIYIVAGESSQEIADILRRREYARVLDWSDLRDESDPLKVDVKKTDRAFDRIPELAQCRPQRVWCLWGIDRSCPVEIREELDARLRKAMINRNTISTFGASWARNFIQNIPNIARCGRDTLAAKDLLKGSGAIVVGAGPSLDTHLEWIRQQTPKPVIITAYKALKALHRNGITPDFVVMLDPNQQLRHLEGVDLSGVAGFLAEVSVRPDVLAQVDRPVMPYFAGDGTRVLASVFGNVKIPTVPTGGSVFHTGLQLAKLLGCTEITLIGADFGFPDDRLYASGSGEGDRFFVSNDKRTYQRAPLDAAQRVGILISAQANDGSTLATSLELDAYRLWTEEFIRDASQQPDPPKFFNLAPRGARIEGADYIDASEHRARAAVKSPLEAVRQLPVLVKNTGADSGLVRKLQAKIKKLRTLKKTCADATDAARKSRSGDLSVYDGVVRQAADCPEVSLLLTQQLQDLDELSRRSAVDAPARLLELIETAEQEAGATADLYAEIVGSLAARGARPASLS